MLFGGGWSDVVYLVSFFVQYRVGQFLYNNNFNVVRLPLSIDSVARNTDIDIDLVNTNSNRAFADVTNYLKMLSLVVQGLGQFKIGVVLDFHVLSAVTADTGGLWYGTSVQMADIKTAIDSLAKLLCNSKHFNVMGIDLKDGLGPSATWGDASDTDWAAAATTLGDYMVKACPKWLAFVQGVQGSAHKDTYDDGVRELKNKFPSGSDLTGVKTAPIKLATSGKLVYAPKYWSSSYLPQQYFFSGGDLVGDMINKYVESSDAMLRKNVLANMNYMFGSTYATGAAVVLSSFGGLMGTEDLTPKLTSTRIVQVLIEQMLASNNTLAGGFWWTLNPDSIWSYPAPDNSNTTTAGLVDETWRAANMDVLNYLANMDKMASLKFIPCIH